MADTDVLQFSKFKLFEGITKNLPECANEVLDIFEDLLFVWNFDNNTLNVSNWRSAKANNKPDGVKRQVLIPSSTQNFTVSKILISYGGGYVAICGSQGLSVIELPARYGPDGLFQDGKSQITCKVINIHEYIADSNKLEIVQIRWHPYAPSENLLLVLLSDNSLRIYDECNLKFTWRVGPLPNHTSSGEKFSFLKSLGDTAIDFDVAPAQACNDNGSPKSSSNLSNLSASKKHLIRNEQKKKIEWPIIILRGNGSIYVICAGLNTEKPSLQGPLTMIPPQLKNYGDDSCSLLIIPSMPVTIVIAENSGILHHVLMTDSNDDHTSFDWNLFVIESIELELCLQHDRAVDGSRIYLKRDPINENRYFCYHDAGLHGVTIGFISQLQKYISDDEVNTNFNITPSRAEYIVSTKVFTESRANSIMGFAQFQSPSGILMLMSSGQIVSLFTSKVIPHQYNLSSHAPNLDQKTIETLPKTPFDQHIKALLKVSENAQLPILKLDGIPPSSKAFQLLMSTIQVMRENKFITHDNVRQEIMKRVKILELMKNQQRDEISELLECKKLIQEKAYKLADKHEDIMERQCRLQKRINDICRLASLKMPSNLIHEKEFADHIKNMKLKVEKIQQEVIQIKAKHETQKKSLDKWNRNGEKFSESSQHLPPKQEETIKEFIGDMMKQIQGLKSDVQKINIIIDH